MILPYMFNETAPQLTVPDSSMLIQRQGSESRKKTQALPHGIKTGSNKHTKTKLPAAVAASGAKGPGSKRQKKFDQTPQALPVMPNEVSSPAARQGVVPQGERLGTQQDDDLRDTLDDQQTLNM